MRMVWRSSLAFSALIAAACAARIGTPGGPPRTPVASTPAATPVATAPDSDPAAPPGDPSDARDGSGTSSNGSATDGAGSEGETPAGVPPRPQGAPANCYVKSKSAGRDQTPADECTWVMMCTSGVEYSVQCDGENDGTGTSLCECSSGGRRWALSKPIEGEAPASCGRASMICLATWPR